MADKKYIDLPSVPAQNTSDLYALSAAGTGSYKETRAQQNIYWNAHVNIPPSQIVNVSGNSLVGNPNPITGLATNVSIGNTLNFSGNILQTNAITGDVTTTIDSFNTTVAKINGVPLGPTTATAGNLLIGSGVLWNSTPMSGDATLTGTGVLTIANNAITTAKIANGAVDLTTKVSGILPIANGGTNLNTYTLGDILYSSATNTLAKLSGNTTTAKQYLSQTGNGTISASPLWSAITGADITGSALTTVNDTNITLTLGGTPATALLRSASITAGWIGQLSASRGGTGIGSYAVGDILYASTSTTLSRLADVLIGNALISGGAGFAPSWGKIGLTTHVTGILPIANGGNNIGSQTTNGVLFNNGTANTTSSNLLYDTVFLQIGGGSANVITRELDIQSKRSFAPANDGVMLSGTSSNGALGSHDYGAIVMGSNPLTSDGGASIFQLRVGGSATRTTSNGLFVQGTTDASNSITEVAFYTGGSTKRAYFDVSGRFNLSSLSVSSPVFTDAGQNLSSSGIVPVNSGGTGLTSGTSGGIPYFNSATSMLSSAVLGIDQIVTGGGAANPPKTNSGFNFNSTSGAANISLASLTTGWTITTSNASAGNESYLKLNRGSKVGGASSVYFQTTSTTDFILQTQAGFSNLYLYSNYNPGSGIIGNVMSVDPTGLVNYPKTASVLAYVPANIANFTGNSGALTVPFSAISYDQNGNFNTGTFQFTSPVPGVYLITMTIALSSLNTNNNIGNFSVIIGGTTFVLEQFNPNNYAMSGGFLCHSASTCVKINSAGVLVSGQLTISGFTSNNVTLVGGIGNTRMCISLIA